MYNIAVHRAHPNRAYAFAKACNHFAKTDKLDAKLLEKYAEFIAKNDGVKECMVSQKQEELKELRAIELNLSDMQTSAAYRMPQEKPENI